MLPNLSELQKKCEILGLRVQIAGKKPAKSDYVKALRNHFLPEGGLPFTELTPMQCFAIWNLKPEEEVKCWSNPNWIAQEKLNGCRIILHFVEGVGIFAHSRTVSLKTYRFSELSRSFLFKDYVPDFSATIDTEVQITKPVDTREYTAKGEVTKSSLHSTTAVLSLNPENARKLQIEQDAEFEVKMFDITNLNGQDLKGRPLQRRMKELEQVCERISRIQELRNFSIPDYTNSSKKEFYKRVISEGGEGVILKNLQSKYVDSSSRSRTGWVKVKRRQEYDAFVTGFKPGEPGSGWEGLVGALEFSIYDSDTGSTHVLGYASNLTMENRKKISIKKDGQLQLLPAVYGKVAEISGQDISARSLRLSHCTIDRWRSKANPDGKTPEACRYSMDDLREGSNWVK